MPIIAAVYLFCYFSKNHICSRLILSFLAKIFLDIQWGNSSIPSSNASMVTFPIAFTNFYKIIVTGSLTWTDSVFNQTINFLNDYENRLIGCAFRTSGTDKPAGIYIAIGI